MEKGHIDSWDGTECSGWFITDKAKKLFIKYDNSNEYIELSVQSFFRPDLVKEGFTSDKECGFKFNLDQLRLIPLKTEKVHVFTPEKDELIGSPILINHDVNFRGHIDRYDGTSISGWVFDENNPRSIINFDVFVNNQKVTTNVAKIFRQDLLEAGLANAHCGFHININAFIDHTKLNKIDFKLANTDINVLSSISILGKIAKSSNLLKLQNIAKKHAIETSDLSLQWVCNNILPSNIDSYRTAPLETQLVRDSYLPLKQNSRAVDIIIPVYKGVRETINCIESLYKVSVISAHEVIVINDCSPESEMSSQLRQLQSKYDFNLLENETNLGFVKTVNKGMKLSNNDVLLLNSDTVVTNSWLDKIIEAAYSDVSIGTVTPFSNNATICSFPRFCIDNELPLSLELEELAATFASVNNGFVIDLPTAHGFAMFIKRDVVNQIGLFDDTKWGKGYAEENDFSLRASRMGWRNVIAPSAFVHHLGSVSFADDAADFIATNLKKLNGIYPDYAPMVEAFIKKDPLRLARNNVALELLNRELFKLGSSKTTKKVSTLFVSLTIGGGTEVAVRDIARQKREDGHGTFLLCSPKAGVWELQSMVDNYVVQYIYENELQDLIKNLKQLNVGEIQYHHTLEFDNTVWELPKELEVPYEVYTHDYYAVCPRVNLIDHTEHYCGEPTLSACERCIKRNGVHENSLNTLEDMGGSVDSWRRIFEERLKQAKRVISPSQDCMNRYSKYFDLENIEFQYHPEQQKEYESISLKDVKTLNVAFIGAIGVHKGLNILKSLAEYAYKFELPLKFIVIGYTADDHYFSNLPNVKITGKYKRDELSKLLEEHECHVAALLSVWPETYSYTLSEALRNNLRICTFSYGAIPERAKQFNPLLIDSYDTSDIINKILALGDLNVQSN